MYRNPRLAASARIDRARNMWKVRTALKTRATTKTTIRRLGVITAVILMLPREHV
jgi:hypothetical protein